MRWPTLCLLLASTYLNAQFTYAPINVPGAVETQARGINNYGEVVGFYKNTPCTDSDVVVPNCPNTKGFKLVNGSYIKLMVPGSSRTVIMGVNDYGDLVGFYTKSADGTTHGFIWYHQNVVKTIDFQGVANATIPFGMNKAGIVVGGFWSTGSAGTGPPGGGWVWANGTFSIMDPEVPNAGACCWSVNGISNNGILSGVVFQSDFFQAWMKESTDQDFFTYPTVTQCCDTTGTGVNNNVDMIGFGGGIGLSGQVGSGWFTKHIELNEGSGDAEVTPHFLTVAYPNSSGTQPLSTFPFGLNDSRWIVGAYFDTNSVLHGFLAKPNF
jgi:hypothetical protein